ncbi:MAG: hypothetical protein HYZ13_09305 [Acidobacteria bacterium]|nr:hypothetical protein [Acidobacteriota bacterium]
MAGILWVLFLLVGGPVPLFGKEPHPDPPGIPFLRSFTPKDYHAAPQNCAVAQDRRGVMYFGNSDGVLEYDGAQWRLIPTTRRTVVRSLALGKDGRIYVGAQGEFGVLAPDPSGRLAFVSLQDRVPDRDRNFTEVWRTLTTSLGIFFSTDERLFLFDGAQVRSWRPSKAFHLSFVVNDRLYVQEVGRGLEILEGEILKPLLGGARFDRDRIFVMLPWEPGRILIGTQRGGFLVYDGATFAPFPTEVDRFLKTHLLYNGCLLADGTLALATTRGGAVLLDRKGKLVRVLDADVGLPSDGVYALFPEAGRGLWMALARGICRAELPARMTQFDARTGLRGAVYSLCRHEGVLYAGTGTGVSRLGPSGFRPLAGIEGQSWNLLSTEDSLLVANNRGVYEVHGDQVRLVRPCATNALSLCRSHGNPAQVYVGLLDGLAVLRQGRDGHWLDGGKVPGIGEQVFSLAEAADGSLWAGTLVQGVLRMAFPKDQPTGPPVVERFGIAQALPSMNHNLVYSVGGDLRLATHAGVYRYDSQARRFEADPRFARMFPEGPRWLSVLREGRDGRLWMNPVNELQGLRETGFALPEPAGSFRWEPVRFPSMADSPIEAILPEKDGVVWLGGPEGLLRLDPSVPGPGGGSFKALIRSITVNGDRVLHGGALEADPKSQILSRSENALRFGYSAPFFVQESTTRFRSLLEGLDRQWSTWSGDTRREYTNLPPGSYRFRVQAQNVYGQVSEEDVFAFRIPRPWWMTWWARGLGALAMGIPVTGLAWWAVFRFRLWRLTTVNAVLRERNRIARDIHDGLGHGLTSIVFLLRSMKPEQATSESPSHQALEVAERTLLDARETAQALWPKALRGGLQEALVGMCKGLGPSGVGRASFLGEPRPVPLEMERQLFRIAEEATSNALRHGKATRIEIRLVWKADAVQLEVQDDGKGFIGETAEGMGLRSMRDRTSSLGGHLTVVSKPGEGTLVQAVVPIPWLWRLRQGLDLLRRLVRTPGRE